MSSFREQVEERLSAAEDKPKLEKFQKAVSKLSSDYIASEVFSLDTLCELTSTPINNSSEEWATYIKTGIYRGVRRFYMGSK